MWNDAGCQAAKCSTIRQKMSVAHWERLCLNIMSLCHSISRGSECFHSQIKQKEEIEQLEGKLK